MALVLFLWRALRLSRCEVMSDLSALRSPPSPSLSDRFASAPQSVLKSLFNTLLQMLQLGREGNWVSGLFAFEQQAASPKENQSVVLNNNNYVK